MSLQQNEVTWARMADKAKGVMGVRRQVVALVWILFRMKWDFQAKV